MNSKTGRNDENVSVTMSYKGETCVAPEPKANLISKTCISKFKQSTQKQIISLESKTSAELLCGISALVS